MGRRTTPGSGGGKVIVLGTRFHALPFQRSMRIASPVDPTVQALRGDVAATAASESNSFPRAPGLGVRTVFQTLPLKRAVCALVGLSPSPVVPTTQARRAETAVTPRRL